MKRLITSAILLLLTMYAVNAQTNSELSNNMPAPSGEGYQFDFEGDPLDNCPGNIPYDQWYMPPSYSVDNMGNDTLYVSTNGDQLGWHRLNMRMSDGNCVDDTIDLSNNQYFELKVHSDTAVPQCLITIFDDQGEAADHNPIVAPLSVGENTITAQDIDFSASDSTYIDSANVVLVGISFRIAWDDNNGGASPSIAGNFKIDYLRIGDTTGLTLDGGNSTSGIAASQVERSLRVYPNPADQHLNVDFDVSSPGTVSLVDITGVTRRQQAFTALQNGVTFNTSEMAGGIYVLKIATEDAVVTRRIRVR